MNILQTLISSFNPFDFFQIQITTMTTQVSKFPLSPIPSMFNFISNSLHWNSYQPTIRLRSLSLSLSSSSLRSSIPIANSSNQYSFPVSYLVNSCGLSLEEALVASKRVNFNIPKKPDIVLSCFKNYGFPEDNIAKIVKKFPRILLCNPSKTLLPKLDYLYSKGISVAEVVEIITDAPDILRRSLKNLIIPSFNVLEDLLESDDEVIHTVKKFPFLLSHNLEAHNVQILREVGVSDSNILSFLSSRRRVFKTTADNFRKTLEEVEKLGFKPSSTSYIWAIKVLRPMRKSTWENKVEIFQKWGWSKDEIMMAFLKCPGIMISSDHKINRVMDFLVHKMGLESSAIASRPGMITRSFEKRIVPRSLLYQVMLEKGLFKKSKWKLSLVSLLWLSEKNFLCRISETCEGEAPEFLRLYKEVVDIMQRNREFDPIQNELDPIQNDTFSVASSIQELVSDAACSEKIRLCFPYLSGSE